MEVPDSSARLFEDGMEHFFPDGDDSDFTDTSSEDNRKDARAVTVGRTDNPTQPVTAGKGMKNGRTVGPEGDRPGPGRIVSVGRDSSVSKRPAKKANDPAKKDRTKITYRRNIKAKSASGTNTVVPSGSFVFLRGDATVKNFPEFDMQLPENGAATAVNDWSEGPFLLRHVINSESAHALYIRLQRTAVSGREIFVTNLWTVVSIRPANSIERMPTVAIKKNSPGEFEFFWNDGYVIFGDKKAKISFLHAANQGDIVQGWLRMFPREAMINHETRAGIESSMCGPDVSSARIPAARESCPVSRSKITPTGRPKTGTGSDVGRDRNDTKKRKKREEENGPGCGPAGPKPNKKIGKNPPAEGKSRPMSHPTASEGSGVYPTSKMMEMIGSPTAKTKSDAGRAKNNTKKRKKREEENASGSEPAGPKSKKQDRKIPSVSGSGSAPAKARGQARGAAKTGIQPFRKPGPADLREPQPAISIAGGIPKNTAVKCKKRTPEDSRTDKPGKEGRVPVTYGNELALPEKAFAFDPSRVRIIYDGTELNPNNTEELLVVAAIIKSIIRKRSNLLLNRMQKNGQHSCESK